MRSGLNRRNVIIKRRTEKDEIEAVLRSIIIRVSTWEALRGIVDSIVVDRDLKSIRKGAGESSEGEVVDSLSRVASEESVN